MSKPEESINNAINLFSKMKDLVASRLLALVTLMFILIAFICYFYYSRLRKRECNIMNAIYGDLNGKIQSIDDSEPFNYLFRDYYIKSAYNCCSGGNYRNDYVDTCHLKYLLKQGVRGLDFEVFSIDDKPVVATSTSNSYYVKETFNYIYFGDIMDIIRNYAFATSTAPNSRDPIIIHLRIKSTNQSMYKHFANMLKGFEDILLSKDYGFEYYGQNFGTVELRKLTGKVVIIVERSNTTFLEVPEFYEFVNLTSNSVFMRALHYYDIKYSPDLQELIEFNRQNMTIGMPDKGTNPENPSSIVLRESGCQLLAMRYQQIDSNIEENDVFFNENGYAFVLKPQRLRYIPVTVEAPPPQDPALSYETRTIQSDFYKFEI
jgi:hypothetical protein